MGCYYLETTRGGEVGRRYLLPDGAITIGRNAENTIILQSTERSVSGHHMIIYKSPERIIVQDLQSTNGTYVNETKVAEQEIAIGDEIGFGKTGPRLKLLFSENEIDLSAPAASARVPEAEIPDSDAFTKDTSARKFDQPAFGNDAAPSYTMELSQKLAKKHMEAGDMQQLMKNGDRLERVLEQGNLGGTQTNMLRAMYGAKRKSTHKWLYLVSVIVVVCGGIATFFAIRAFQYQKLIDKAQSLKKDIEEYDRKIAVANSNPEANKNDLQRMINELEVKEKSFSSLQTKIKDDDYGKFYSDPVERDIDKILRQFGETDYHIPKDMLEQVKFFIKVYSVDMHGMMGHYIERKEIYFPMIQRTFREKKLPVELAYISMLESGFNPKALSSVGARGLWQFMPYTGRHYGLRIEGDLDERTDPDKATVAAVKYFKELIGMFGGKSSVMLCMAAYNAGEGSVMNALRKIDDPMSNRDFWYIYRMGYLPKETMEYIPRAIALMIISENPKQYGYADKAYASNGSLESATDFVEVKTDRTSRSDWSGNQEPAPRTGTTPRRSTETETLRPLGAPR
jgi:hypothetical protein